MLRPHLGTRPVNGEEEKFLFITATVTINVGVSGYWLLVAIQSTELNRCPSLAGNSPFGARGYRTSLGRGYYASRREFVRGRSRQL